jgi:hypothetical protein
MGASAETTEENGVRVRRRRREDGMTGEGRLCMACSGSAAGRGRESVITDYTDYTDGREMQEEKELPG